MREGAWYAAIVYFGLFASAALSVAAEPATPAGDSCLVFIGTYTGPKSQGIYAYRLNLGTGDLTPLGLAAELKSPSFLAVHPNRKFLYAVNEITEPNKTPVGGITAMSIDRATGKLQVLNQQSSTGAGPCHLVVDASGEAVLVANYGGGSVALLPIDKQGKLSPASASIQHEGHSVNPSRQKEPHAHSINVDPTNHFAVAADLGLDKVLVYRLDAARGGLTPNDPPAAVVAPGAGPRHFAFHPSGKFGYVINEILCTVTAFKYDGMRGQLSEVQTISTLPDGEPLKPEYSTAEVQVHPSGKFLYGSNRGHDTMAVFRVDPSTGELSLVEHASTKGKTPRGFGIDPTGKYLLAGNQDSHTVIPFRIDAQTGRLTATGETLEVGSPVCVKFVLP